MPSLLLTSARLPRLHTTPARFPPRTNPPRKTQIFCSPTEEAEVEINTCPGCGVDLSEAPNNCDREGHISSGLGTVVGFEWWPIKVYRPCPAYEAAGKVYVRKGQITNEILFRRKDRTEL